VSAAPVPSADNPLYAYDLPPRFDAITPAHIAAAISDLVARQDAGLAELEAGAAPTWAGLVEPLARLGEPLGWAWGVIGHLLGVRNTPELRAAHETVQPAVIAAGLRQSQSEPLYRGLLALRDSTEWNRLDDAQRRIVDLGIRSAQHSGIGLHGAARERFNQLEATIGELATAFANRLLDATKAWGLDLTSADEVAGLPPSLRASAAQAARAAGHSAATAENGPWRITLEGPLYGPFLEHARRRNLRERVYRAGITRASSGDTDNQPVLERILALRRLQAGLLGYASYAEVSLARKMAENVATVEHLLDELRAAALPRARGELAELQTFARAESGDAGLELAHWDVAFWAERQRERRFAFTDEELRPFFALPAVLDGLFALARRLFGVVVTPADGEAPVWHGDVRFFRIADQSGAPLAAFYLDPYSRPADKRGGAWMDECLHRKRRADGSVRLPIAYLVCNQTPPITGGSGGAAGAAAAGDTPSLMTFREVETLFHEFGHGLQHMLTTVDHADAAGIRNVEWDAVELPSQFMENWCYHRPTLMGFARHWQTGAALPGALFDKILSARTYRAGSAVMRQLHLATLDLELHHRYVPGRDAVEDIAKRVSVQNAVLPRLPDERFLCSFSHIFAGGYAAGYYSYKWAEVLSADAFAAFEEAGLDDDAAVAATGRRFRDTVLSLGGSRHPLAVFTAFRGRGPNTAALLRHYGLAS